MIDFLSGEIQTLLKTASRRQPLARAVGMREGLFILDATAGLGRDALFFSSLGAKVVACERNPDVFRALQEAEHRARQVPTWLGQFSIPPVFLQSSLEDYARDATPEMRPDVVYLDPMYPTTPKSALPRKEIQWLRELVGPQNDIEDLLAVSMKLAKERVVLKRPRELNPIGHPRHSYESKLVRFDMYSLG